MKNRDPDSLADILKHGELRFLADEARRREALTTRVRALLPADEAAHLVSAGETGEHELTLIMDSSAWAARVRFRAEELGAKRLKVRVLPAGD